MGDVEKFMPRVPTITCHKPFDQWHLMEKVKKCLAG